MSVVESGGYSIRSLFDIAGGAQCGEGLDLKMILTQLHMKSDRFASARCTGRRFDDLWYRFESVWQVVEGTHRFSFVRYIRKESIIPQIKLSPDYAVTAAVGTTQVSLKAGGDMRSREGRCALSRVTSDGVVRARAGQPVEKSLSGLVHRVPVQVVTRCGVSGVHCAGERRCSSEGRPPGLRRVVPLIG